MKLVFKPYQIILRGYRTLAMEIAYLWCVSRKLEPSEQPPTSVSPASFSSLGSVSGIVPARIAVMIVQAF